MATRGSIIDKEGRAANADDLQLLSAGIRTELDQADHATTRVAILCTDSAAFITAASTVIDAGFVAVPLSDRAPKVGTIGDDLLAERLEHADADLVLGDEDHADVVRRAGYRQLDRSAPGPATLWQRSDRSAAAHPAGSALIVYTSGSTGKPKGAIIDRTALADIASTNNSLYSWRPTDRFLSALPLSHLAGLTNCLSALDAGVDVVVAPAITFVDRVLDTIAEQQVTVAGLVPYQLERLFGAERAAELSNLRLTVTSAAPLTKSIIDLVRAAAPRLDLRNAYGLTEAFRSIMTAVNPANPDAPLIGRPRPGVRAELRPTDDPSPGGALELTRSSTAPIEPGSVGELWLSGPNLFSGYWDQAPDADDPVSDGWFRTGDLASIDSEGNYRLAGRRNNIVNVGGEKTSIEAIEVVLDDVAPGAIAAAVRIGKGSGDEVVAIAEAGADTSLHQIRRACSGRLPASLRPRDLITVAELPRTGAGKHDRRALTALVNSITKPEQTTTTEPAKEQAMTRKNPTTTTTEFDQFIGQFSTEYASEYTVVRPTYPSELFDWLAGAAPATGHAWDAGTGGGELAVQLADRFDRVTGTDSNADMLASARVHPGVTYREVTSEGAAETFPSQSVDVVTSGMAAHWFDLDVFYETSRAALAPGGLMALVGFYFFDIENGIGDHVRSWYLDNMVGYESAQLTVLRNGYRDLEFPFDDVETPAFEMTAEWNLGQLAAFLSNWIVVKRAREAGNDVLADLIPELARLWPTSTDQALQIRWPLFIRAATFG